MCAGPMLSCEDQFQSFIQLQHILDRFQVAIPFLCRPIIGLPLGLAEPQGHSVALANYHLLPPFAFRNTYHPRWQGPNRVRIIFGVLRVGIEFRFCFQSKPGVLSALDHIVFMDISPCALRIYWPCGVLPVFDDTQYAARFQGFKKAAVISSK